MIFDKICKFSPKNCPKPLYHILPLLVNSFQTYLTYLKQSISLKNCTFLVYAISIMFAHDIKPNGSF